MMVTLGLCSGLIVHTTAVALGVAAIFQTSVVAFKILKVAGTLGRWLNSSPKAQIYLNRIAGTIFTGLALKLVTSSANAE